MSDSGGRVRARERGTVLGLAAIAVTGLGGGKAPREASGGQG